MPLTQQIAAKRSSIASLSRQLTTCRNARNQAENEQKKILADLTAQERNLRSQLQACSQSTVFRSPTGLKLRPEIPV